MCSYQTLFYSDEEGYVIHCTGCNSIQVAFGNILLTWNRTDFYDFYRYIKQLFIETPNDIPANKKTLAIPVPCEGIRLLLSPRELQQLNHMLDTAESELQSLQLIQMLNGAED